MSSTFAIPLVTATATVGGRKRKMVLRYAVRLPFGERDGDDVLFVRSHGADFNIVPALWIDRGLSRVFSIGPGVTAAAEEHLVVLVQCFDPQLRHRTIAESLERCGADVVTSAAEEYGLPCLRISALFPDVRYPVSATRTGARD